MYGIGVGPGDPEWITVKAARILAECRHVCVPRSAEAADSVALEIARRYLRPDAVVHELTFPMTADAGVLRRAWRRRPGRSTQTLAAGEDCCFLTLGDPLLYSTYIYLLRELRAIDPAVTDRHRAGRHGLQRGGGPDQLPRRPGQAAGDDRARLRRLGRSAAALDRGGTVVLMKIGRRLQRVLDELEPRGLLDRAVFVSHAGMAQQRIETDLRRLRGAAEEAGYLSILMHPSPPIAKP